MKTAGPSAQQLRLSWKSIETGLGTGWTLIETPEFESREDQKEAILKFKKIQQKKLKNQKKNQRNNSMKQIGFANNLNIIKNKSHLLSSNNLIEK